MGACAAPPTQQPAPAAEGAAVEWGYEGEIGPENWSTLSGNFATCGLGTEQSPIDLSEPAPSDEFGPLELNYAATPITVLNNGHTIELEYEPGSTLTFNGQTYELVQFHFHNPSEHTLTGEASPLEAHLVHRDNNGNLAVIGVFLMLGEANPFLAQFWDALPAAAGETEVEGEINVRDLLPEDLSYHTYTGSLTTPPCSEGVRWLVLRDTVTISQEQVDAFTAIYSGNARPVQPLNDRDLLTNADNVSLR
ncbi:MAG: carbonic anhydrase family protein [Chloroflexaceae bacterium]|nr:carbonic anhydrase family protein [Chloroflexaceae bacterium]